VLQACELSEIIEVQAIWTKPVLQDLASSEHSDSSFQDLATVLKRAREAFACSRATC
jgi:hypothetical protein